jgi:hypothetical protein
LKEQVDDDTGMRGEWHWGAWPDGRVARWYLFKPKIPIWLNFGGASELKMLVYFMVIWNILQPFGTFNVH